MKRYNYPRAISTCQQAPTFDPASQSVKRITRIYSAKNFFALSGFILLILVACKKEKQQHDSTPLHYITESEAMTLPAAVELPQHSNGYTRTATFYATGVQMYRAVQKAGSNPVSYEWVFVAPKADLYNITNKKVGTHGAGPFWQLSAADSIFAQPHNPPKSALSPNGNSIDWLLLVPKAGKIASGQFAGTDYIQRMATTGGKAPVTLPQHANETAEVPYTAIYRFSRKNP